MKGALFSNYFLNEGIKTTKEWEEIYDKKLDNIYSKVTKIFEEMKENEDIDEADTEDNLIKPIIELFGFKWTRQKNISKKGKRDVPDFILFHDEDSKKIFDKKPKDQKPWDKAICILEGKKWKKPLDKGDKTNTLDPNIPSNQILRYLSIVEPVSNGNIIWGILTNGEVWRLYYHRASSRAEGFIEFNLSEIFKNADKERFKVFYLLFRKEAFISTEGRPFKTFLEISLEEGKRWEERVSQNLKEKIFYEVFPDIAKGFFIDAKTKGGGNIDETFLQRIYNNTLILLYRLLFILYAEDRDLLPIRSDEYKSYSLSKIRNEIAEKIDRGETLSESASSYYGRIKDLFKIINDGDKSLKIPPYNGGLFDSQKHPFLKDFSISDKFLVPAIDKLSRDHTMNPPKRINYRDLSVRQLGSIYEGLLEFKLKIAETNLGVKKEKKREVYSPVSNKREADIKKGELYLTNDKSERRSTGSYYTPDYIVQYIVKNSIEPFIEKRINEFDKYKKELETKNKNQLINLVKKHKIDNKKGEKSPDYYRNKVLSLKDPAKEILKIKILDPAMGSGHFLVGAVDYIADRILEILAETSGEKYFGKEVYRSPLLEKLEEIREHILKKAQKADYAIDDNKLEDKNLIKRIILKRCIYGVDINPLAVELAKVSLWLHTFTVGAPLSFLDHHLKCGNSLISADPEDFEKMLSRTIFGSKFAGRINAIKFIEKLQNYTDSDISEVKESGEIYNKVINILKPYKELLDVYTADLILKPKKKSELKRYESPLELVNGTRGNPLDVVSKKINLNEEEQNLINKALDLAQRKKFFHWKLEFPEVWYGEKKEKTDSGFDAIIGNPPYVEFKRLDKEAKDILKKLYKTATKKFDLYVPFIEKSIKLLSASGHLSFICPQMFYKRDYGVELRKFLVKNCKSIKIIDFGSSQIFKDIINYVAIIDMEKLQNIQDKIIKIAYVISDHAEVLNRNNVHFTEIKLSKDYSGEEWMIIPFKLKNTISLEKIAERISVGIQTGKDEVFFIKRNKFNLDGEDNIWKTILKGEDIQRYFIQEPEVFVFYPYSLTNGKKQVIPENKLKKDYPKTYKYLQSKLNLLMKRICFEGKKKIWYELCYERDPLIFETAPKIVVQEISNSNKFTVDESHYYFNTKVYGVILPNDSKWDIYALNAILASHLCEYIYKHISSPKEGGYFEYKTQFLKKIPIPAIKFTSRNRKKLEELKSKYKENKFKEIQNEIKLLPLNSVILHDFLSFLARKMTEIMHNKYLLELFIGDKLEHGSKGMIMVKKMLGNHPEWSNGVSENVEKEIAMNLKGIYEEKSLYTDEIIDKIVYHLYGLNENEIKIIEKFFNKN